MAADDDAVPGALGDARRVRLLFSLAAALRTSAKRAIDVGDHERANELTGRAAEHTSEAFALLARLRMTRRGQPRRRPR